MSVNPVIFSEPVDDIRCKKIFALDNSIRFVGVASTDGNLLDLQYRDDINPLLSDDSLKNAVKKSAIRHISRCEYLGDMGMPLYTVTSYENVKRMTIPMGDKLFLLVSFEKNKDETKIINQILKEISKN